MGTYFLKETFNLCNKIQKSNCGEKIKLTIKDIYASGARVNAKDNSRFHYNYVQFARNISKQFYGYLVIDDNVEDFKLSEIYQVDHLNEDERFLFEQGHNTLMRLVELCLADIRKKSNAFAEAINPLFICKKINLRCDAQPLLSDDDYSNIVSAFKCGKIYNKLYNSDFDLLIDKINSNDMKTIMNSITKDMISCYNNDVSNNISNLSLRLGKKQIHPQDILYMYAILLFALQESLHLACQLIFDAICGDELTVLNNNNIFAIDPTTGFQVCKHYKISIQDILFTIKSDSVGKIALIDCDIDDKTHLHEFGLIIRTATQLVGECASTSKISLVAIDDEANPITYLTDTILKHGLPKKASS